MKKTLAFLLALLLTAALAACGGPALPAEPAEVPAEYAELAPVTLIGADSSGKGAAGQLFGEYVAARVFERTGGRLRIDYHPNGELGGDADLIRQMQSNEIQLVVCQTAPIVSFVPELAVFDLPMFFAGFDGDTIDAALNGDNAFTRDMGAAYEAQRLHLLGFLQSATYRLTTANAELRTLDDFKNLQIRTMDNRNHMAFWQAIGAEPTPLAWAEVYFSLQSGAIDAQENAADTCVSAGFQDVQRCLACTNHILYCNQICISAEAWDALAPAYRDALEQAVADAVAWMRPQLAQLDADSKQTLREGGMTVVEYDEAFFDEVLALDGVRALYERIGSETGGLSDELAAALG